MDCCHILLRRPWQYDRSAMYDGRENKYTIMKDGQRFVLTPWVEDEKGKAKVIMCGGK